MITQLIHSLHPAKHRAIIRAAPTGIASKNISGVTIHRAFNLPIQKLHEVLQYMKLGARLLGEKRHLLKDLWLLNIDEISMISYTFLRFIHLRLCEIFETDEPFGGINVIMFGDLLQIAPVGYKAII